MNDLNDWKTAIIHAKALSSTQKFFALALWELSEDEHVSCVRFAKISYSSASAALKIGTKTVYRCAQKLSDEGFIKIIHQQGKGYKNQANIYELIMPG
jgi:DNA-binding PadR family transcriptional regulator